MSEKILQQILSELKGVKTDLKDVKTDLNNVKSQVDENTQMMRAIYDRQEETDAKLESIAQDVHEIKEDIVDIKDKLEFTFLKTSKNELDIFKLRREHMQ